MRRLFSFYKDRREVGAMFAFFRNLSWFFKAEWKRYTIAILFLCMVNVLEVLPPKLVGLAIDDMTGAGLTSSKMMEYIVYLLLILFFSYWLGYVWSRLLFGGSFLVERKLRSRFVGHLLKMTPTFFEKNRTGDLMARATNDLNAISMAMGYGMLSLADSVLFTFAIIMMMGITISWKLTVAAILPLPILAILLQILVTKIFARFSEAQASFGNLNDKVLESVSGVRVIRAYVQERRDEQQFAKMADDVYKKNIGVAKVDAMFSPIITIVIGASYLISLGYGSYLVFQQVITLGNLVTFNVYLSMLVWPMIAIGDLMNVIQRGNVSLNRIQNILSYKADVTQPSSPEKGVRLSKLHFDNVSFTYPTSTVKNLSNVSVQLERGQTLGIVGKTGSGKTTFIKQLLREYPLESGRVAIADVDIQKLDSKELSGWLGYVPQEPFLFSASIRQNILFGKLDATEEELLAAIRLADFEKDLQMLPEQLETLVGEKGVALSGGQRQRLSIARALIKKPELLILDDSLSAVDAKTEATIINNIQNERAGKTTIITTHRLSAVEHADWILVLEDGMVVEEGKHVDLLKKDGWYKEQYERQQVVKEMEV